MSFTRVGDDPTIKVEHVEYHRNGISGEGFFSVTFQWHIDGAWHNMLGVVFDYDEYPARYPKFYNPRTAVLDRDQLVPAGGVEASPFGGGIPNFRGDHFNDELREAIRTAVIEHDVESGHYTREEAEAAHERRVQEALRRSEGIEV